MNDERKELNENELEQVNGGGYLNNIRDKIIQPKEAGPRACPKCGTMVAPMSTVGDRVAYQCPACHARFYA